MLESKETKEAQARQDRSLVEIIEEESDDYNLSDAISNARGDVLAGTDPYGHLWFREEEVAEVIRNYVEHTAEENKPKEVKGKTDVRKKKKSD